MQRDGPEPVGGPPRPAAGSRSGARSDPCLARHRGRTLQRNACRAPWENRLDARLAHTLRIGGGDVRLEGDVINLLSLADAGWGNVERTLPVVPLLELCQINCLQGPLPAIWGGGVLPKRDEEGRLRPTEPWTVVSPDSRWQMQLGARVTFGAARR